MQRTRNTIDSGVDLRRACVAARAAGKRLGLVPTMGALHEGHLSLVRAARAECDWVAATIFVNPTQFGPSEDFQRYPRTLDDDLALLGRVGVQAVFTPSVEELYPADFSTYVEPPRVAALWEGALRPGHFRGVATIVLKLFHLAPVDAAFFGEKDYQQLRVVTQMARDLNLPIEIRGCPTVREPDGLALSSRNRYLRPEERGAALGLWGALRHAQRRVDEGQRDGDALCAEMRQALLDAGVSSVDYAALVDPRTLESKPRLDGPTRALVAARVGATRLIDNAPLEIT